MRSGRVAPLLTLIASLLTFAANAQTGAIVSTYAGSPGISGTTDGVGSAARFNNPYQAAVAPDGTALVVEGVGSLRDINPAGAVTTRKTSAGTVMRVGTSYGVAFDAEGVAYVSDFSLSVIHKVTGGAKTVLAGNGQFLAGELDGHGSDAQFAGIAGLAYCAGALFSADMRGSTIRRISLEGEVTTVAGSPGNAGTADGDRTTARLYWPRAVACGPNGALYIGDENAVRVLSTDGTLTTIAGQPDTAGAVNGPAAAARFNYIQGITVDARGTAYVAEFMNSTIRRIRNGRVDTIAGEFLVPGTQDGDGSVARFKHPYGIAISADGQTLYVCDTMNLTVRKIELPRVLAGDVNVDGDVTPADVFFLINGLFAAGTAAGNEGDVNGDGQISPADVFYLINYLFAGGATPVD